MSFATGVVVMVTNSDHREPVLEAIHWKRVVVDELHETFESARDLRQLKLFTWDYIWGLTATPILDTEHAQHLYLFLAREKAHHPNLLSKIIQHGVRCSSPVAGGAGGSHIPPTRPSSRGGAGKGSRILPTWRTLFAAAPSARTASLVSPPLRIETLRAKLEGHERSVRIMESTSRELRANWSG